MECPHCGHENLPGVERCVECLTSLQHGERGARRAAPPRAFLGAPVRELEPGRALCLSPEESVARALEAMRAWGLGCVLAVEGDRLVGILTERDVLLKRAGAEPDLTRLPIRSVMSREVETLAPSDGIVFALNKMSVGGHRYIPIVEGDRPTGVVSIREVFRFVRAAVRGGDGPPEA